MNDEASDPRQGGASSNGDGLAGEGGALRTPRESIGVYLLADQALARAGLRSLLERGGVCRVLGEGSVPAGQAPLIARTLAEVVVCASYCAPLRKLGWLAALKRRCPNCRVLLMAEPADQPSPRMAFRSGVDGMLPAAAEPYELRLALDSIRHGYPWLSPALCAPSEPEAN